MKMDATRFDVIAAAAIAVSLGGFLWMDHRPMTQYAFTINSPDQADDDAYDPDTASQDSDDDACSDDEESSLSSGGPSQNQNRGMCLGDPLDLSDSFPI